MILRILSPLTGSSNPSSFSFRYQPASLLLIGSMCPRNQLRLSHRSSNNPVQLSMRLAHAMKSGLGRLPGTPRERDNRLVFASSRELSRDPDATSGSFLNDRQEF